MKNYKFRVLLDNTNNEEIFRDITLSSDSTFEDFYNIIIEAFFFKGDQMASFYMSNNSWDKGQEITLMNMGDLSIANAPLTMADTLLFDEVKSENQKIILVYDFLKMWCFLIELIETTEDSPTLPTITLSIGIAPEENSRIIDLNDDFLENNTSLGSEFDDIFSEFNDEEDFGGFENIDDLDI